VIVSVLRVTFVIFSQKKIIIFRYRHYWMLREAVNTRLHSSMVFLGVSGFPRSSHVSRMGKLGMPFLDLVACLLVQTYLTLNSVFVARQHANACRVRYC